MHDGGTLSEASVGALTLETVWMRSARISLHSCRSCGSFRCFKCTGYSIVSSSGVAGFMSPHDPGSMASFSSVLHLSSAPGPASGRPAAAVQSSCCRLQPRNRTVSALLLKLLKALRHCVCRQSAEHPAQSSARSLRVLLTSHGIEQSSRGANFK